MKYVGLVQGSEAQAKPIIINGDIVYIHKDIKKVQREDEIGVHEHYEYYEYLYDRDEYLQILTQQNEEMMVAIAELGTMVAGDANA